MKIAITFCEKFDMGNFFQVFYFLANNRGPCGPEKLLFLQMPAKKCFFENIAFNNFTFTALHSVDLFLHESQILKLFLTKCLRKDASLKICLQNER